MTLLAALCGGEAFAGFVSRLDPSETRPVVRAVRDVVEPTEAEGSSSVQLSGDRDDAPPLLSQFDEHEGSFGGIPPNVSGPDFSGASLIVGWKVSPTSERCVVADSRLRLPEGFPVCLLKIPISSVVLNDEKF